MARKSIRRRASKGLPLPDMVALLLQGGGALGSYQAGVFEQLVAEEIHPDFVAGISIGAINSAVIAGNPPEQACRNLRALWEEMTSGGAFRANFLAQDNDIWRQFNHAMGAMEALSFGVGGFFRPHILPPFLAPQGSAEAISYYDTSPMIETLNRYVDWDYLNDGPVRLAVGAVNVESGNINVFDTGATGTHKVRFDARHILASGALPPGFPPIEIDGQYYWDGGLLSNTPLDYVLRNQDQDMLIFQIDLFPAQGKRPDNMGEVQKRINEIRYSSRTRRVSDDYIARHKRHDKIRKMLEHLPKELSGHEDVKAVREMITSHATNIVHLIYRSAGWERNARDYEFSRATMEEHWRQGVDALRRTIRSGDVLAQNIIDGKSASFDIDGKS